LVSTDKGQQCTEAVTTADTQPVRERIFVADHGAKMRRLPGRSAAPSA
jgi:hypothetical protein